MKKKSHLYIGTSGWMYKDWGEEFYPKDLKKGHLTFLANEFNTVEVNSSFYHLPTYKTFEKWYLETPEKFIFAVKLSRFITHQKKLKDVADSLSVFLENAKGLQEKLGVVLIQLPPWLRFDNVLIKTFISLLPRNVRFALEPRHVSWLESADIVRKILQKENIAIVFPHSAKIPSFAPEEENITADFIYIRFHGPSEFAASQYGADQLRPWADKIRKWYKKGFDVFVYFNNDIHGHAIHDARILKQQLGI